MGLLVGCTPCDAANLGNHAENPCMQVLLLQLSGLDEYHRHDQEQHELASEGGGLLQPVQELTMEWFCIKQVLEHLGDSDICRLEALGCKAVHVHVTADARPQPCPASNRFLNQK